MGFGSPFGRFKISTPLFDGGSPFRDHLLLETPRKLEGNSNERGVLVGVGDESEGFWARRLKRIVKSKVNRVDEMHVKKLGPDDRVNWKHLWESTRSLCRVDWSPISELGINLN